MSEAIRKKKAVSEALPIPLVRPDLPRLEEIKSELEEILSTGKVSNFGRFLQRFETELEKFLGTRVATVSSGTQGLILSLQALGLKPNEKVILPSFSFMATAHAVLYAGGIPVFAEISEDMTVSVEDLRRQIVQDSAIRAIIPVHTYGLPADVDGIQSLVSEFRVRHSRDIHVVYDAAHAFGAALGSRKVGQFGNAEVFSLSSTKTLVAVEGGLVSSRDETLIERIKKMRNYGILDNYNTHFPGMNGKMSEFHAIVGYQSLKKIDWILTERTKKSGYYRSAIEQETGFRVIPTPANVKHTFKDFTVFLPGALKGKRTQVMQHLKESAIDTRAYFFPPIHEQEFFKRFHHRPLPATERLSRNVLTLPFFTTITEAQMDRVAECLKDAERRLS